MRKTRVNPVLQQHEGCVDVCASINPNHTCDAAVRRWPTRMLSFMLSVAYLNAYHLFVTQYPDSDVTNRKRVDESASSER